MEYGDGGNEEAPDRQLRTIGAQGRRPRGQRFAQSVNADQACQGHDGIKPVQEFQLRITGPVTHTPVVGQEGRITGEPSHMGPPEPLLLGGVEVLIGV